MAARIARLSQRPVVQAVAWTALNGLLALVFVLLLLLDDATHPL